MTWPASVDACGRARSILVRPQHGDARSRCYASAVLRITSRQSAVVKEYRDAARGETPGTLLLDGLHLIGEAIVAGVGLRHVMVALDQIERPDVSRLLRQIDADGVTIGAASGTVMDAVSPVKSTSDMVALAARPAFEASPYAVASPLVVVICDMQNPGNVGAIVRVAEAAGASGVVVAGQSADPYGWKALRGSMGSALRVPISLEPSAHDAVTNARRHGASIVATVPREGVQPFEATLSGPTALLIGGEGVGLAPDVVDTADQRVSIPMNAPVESLNAAVAAAVLLYEARRQRPSATLGKSHASVERSRREPGTDARRSRHTDV